MTNSSREENNNWTDEKRMDFFKNLFNHDMNNIFQNILSGIQIARELIKDPNKIDSLGQNFNIIEEQILRGSNYLSNIQKIEQIDEYPKKLENRDILLILRDGLERVNILYKNRNLNIILENKEDHYISYVNDLIKIVFENIIINAIILNNNDVVNLVIRLENIIDKNDKKVKLEFIDKANGIEESLQNEIFNISIDNFYNNNRLGFGLSIVYWIIKSYKGEIYIKSKNKDGYLKGSNFVLIIPSN